MLVLIQSNTVQPRGLLQPLPVVFLLLSFSRIFFVERLHIGYSLPPMHASTFVIWVSHVPRPLAAQKLKAPTAEMSLLFVSLARNMLEM